MSRSPDKRRRSPGFVRSWSLDDLHAVALRFNHQRETEDLTGPQEWLWDGIISELEYRQRRALADHTQRLCVCELCSSPFEPELPFGDPDPR